MAQNNRNGGASNQGAPETIALSDEELARLFDQAPDYNWDYSGGTSIVSANSASANMSSDAGRTPTTSVVQSNSTNVSYPNTSIATQQGVGGLSGSFGTPSTTVTSVTGGNSGGTFGIPPTGTSGGRVNIPINTGVSRLPEYWGLHLVLILLSLAGVIMIVKNLPAILIAIANFIYSLVNSAMLFGIFILIVLLFVYVVFGRRRRYW